MHLGCWYGAVPRAQDAAAARCASLHSAPHGGRAACCATSGCVAPQCCTLLGYALLCRALPCCAVLCCALLCSHAQVAGQDGGDGAHDEGEGGECACKFCGHKCTSKVHLMQRAGIDR